MKALRIFTGHRGLRVATAAVLAVTVGYGLLRWQSARDAQRYQTQINDLQNSSRFVEYVSPTGLFSLRYPAGWSRAELEPGTAHGHRGGASFGPSATNPNVVSVSLFTSSLSPHDWRSQDGSDPKLEDRDITVNGLPAYYVRSGTTRGANPHQSRSYIMADHGNILSLTMDERSTVAQSEDNSRYIDDFEALVKSVRFR